MKRAMRAPFGTALHERIRHARGLAEINQSALARKVGVRPSAVWQWESPVGTAPSVRNLIEIATVTHVAFEWLATGRGPVRREGSTQDPVVHAEEFTRSQLEDRILIAFRRISARRQPTIVTLIEELANRR